MGISLVVQWLRLLTPNAGGPGSIPGQGTRFHMPQLRSGAAKYINKYFKKQAIIFFCTAKFEKRKSLSVQDLKSVALRAEFLFGWPHA